MARGFFEKRGSMWTVRYRDTEGRNRRQSGFRTKKEAEGWLDERLAEQRAGLRDDPDMTFERLARQYLDTHTASPARIAKLEAMAKLANASFGNVAVGDLTPQRIGGWARTLSEGTRWDAVQAVKQILNAAVEWRYLAKSPGDAVKNPVPIRKEFVPFATWDEIEAIERAIHPHYRGLVTFVVGTGLRPQEWPKLQWQHIDWQGKALNLPPQVTKDKRPRRVPLRKRVLDVLEERRQSSGLVFTSHTGGAIEIRSWRRYVWKPAQEKALPDLPVRRPYDMRHTYATWALRAGLSTFMLARRMGTSVQMIDQNYGHFTTDSESHELMLLDSFDMLVRLGADGNGSGSALANIPSADTAQT